MLFLHSLIKLGLLIWRDKKYPHRVPSQIGEGGYAQPPQPIPVTLARDEELGLSGSPMSDAAKDVTPAPPPPAYGLWRGSVVSDLERSRWVKV